MGLTVLIEHGVQAIKSNRSQLEAQVGVGLATSALLALDKLPAVLSGLNELAWQESALPRDRAALTVVMSYGLRTEDLIPAVGDNTLLGVLDDAYLAFFAAAHVHQALPGISAEQIKTGTASLAAVLPTGIRARLERELIGALDEIEAVAKAVH